MAAVVQMPRSDVKERERDISMGNLSELGPVTRDHFSVNAMALAAAKRRIEHLERAIALETQRRHEEELRALLEGSAQLPTDCNCDGTDA
jgi:BMFP domain-containing protein YqiC